MHAVFRPPNQPQLTQPKINQLRGEVASLQAEAARLRRSGVEAVAAYTRKKERCDEVCGWLVGWNGCAWTARVVWVEMRGLCGRFVTDARGG
jgi:hypothetical protein